MLLLSTSARRYGTPGCSGRRMQRFSLSNPGAERVSDRLLIDPMSLDAELHIYTLDWNDLTDQWEERPSSRINLSWARDDALEFTVVECQRKWVIVRKNHG